MNDLKELIKLGIENIKSDNIKVVALHDAFAFAFPKESICGTCPGGVEKIFEFINKKLKPVIMGNSKFTISEGAVIESSKCGEVKNENATDELILDLLCESENYIQSISSKPDDWKSQVEAHRAKKEKEKAAKRAAHFKTTVKAESVKETKSKS